MSDGSGQTIIDVPSISPKGFSTRLRIIKSHMEGDVMVIDEPEIISFAWVGDPQTCEKFGHQDECPQPEPVECEGFSFCEFITTQNKRKNLSSNGTKTEMT